MPPNCPYGRPRTYPFPVHSPALPRNSAQVYRISRMFSTAAPDLGTGRLGEVVSHRR